MARFGYFKAFFSLVCLLAFALTSYAQTPAPTPTVLLPEQHQPENVIGKSNLYCAGFIRQERLPQMPEIVGAEEEQEQRKFSDGDVVYLNAGSAQGIKEGQTFQIIRPRGDVKGVHKQKRGFVGTYIQDVGQLEVFKVRENTSAAQITMSCDQVLLDPAPGGDDDGALALLHRMRTVAPDPVVVIWMEQPTVEFAVRAMRAGALDVLEKSSEPAQIRSVADRAIAHGALAREVRRLRGEVERARGLGEVIGASPLMRQLLAMIDRVAASDATVLIVGESGTGKELLAQGIHRASQRSAQPFIAVNCAAFPEPLLESELFGYEEGAFTGARRGGKVGLFEAAHTGTLFLDEVGEMPVPLQTRLLRVLQEKEIRPIGSDKTFPVDVRVVAGTNRDLSAEVASGRFREDLLYRLRVIEIAVPPLRSRKVDIPALAEHFLAKHAEELGEGCLPLACDVSDAEQVAALAAAVEEAWGGVDILVNNAGIGIFTPVADLTPDDWRAVIETNLNGVYYCCHEAIPLMRKRGGGYIFNLSSLAGRNAFPSAAAYNASKFGLNGFSEALMQEVRYDGIRVSYLMPGSVATAFGRGSEAKAGWALQPADVAAVVLDLLRSPKHALYSRVEMRPSQPPKKG